MSIDFHKLRVAEVRRETPDAVSVRFELPEHLRDAFQVQSRPTPHLPARCERRRICAATIQSALRPLKAS